VYSNSAQRPDQAKAIHPLIYKGPESELPSGYNKDCLIAMPRDPYWLFFYWDFAEQTWQKIAEYKNHVCLLKISSEGTEITSVPVSISAKSWYVNANSPGLSLTAHLGFETDNGFLPILTSNTVCMPRDSISSKTDELWLFIDELYRSEYFGTIGGSPLFWQVEGNQKAQYAASPMPPAKLKEGEDLHHYLVVDTDLIVYGKTTPDSALIQNGQAVPVDCNGNFEIRLKLCEWLHEIELVSFAQNGQVKTKNITVKRG